jgi:hypothetical protein
MQFIQNHNSKAFSHSLGGKRPFAQTA